MSRVKRHTFLGVEPGAEENLVPRWLERGGLGDADETGDDSER